MSSGAVRRPQSGIRHFRAPALRFPSQAEGASAPPTRGARSSPFGAVVLSLILLALPLGPALATGIAGDERAPSSRPRSSDTQEKLVLRPSRPRVTPRNLS
jgi:hypothetical protein